MQIVTSWMEQGIEQGKREEALSLIMRQLPRRVGPIAPNLQDRLNQLKIAQLRI